MERAAYERAALDHYWVVDPASPSVTVLERVDGRGPVVAHGRGATPVTVKRPFVVTVVAADTVP
jgi:hypothetical protein